MTDASAAPAAPIPIPIARALRQVSVHPSVVGVEIVDLAGDELVCAVDIRTEMPATWRAAGQSPIGVRVVETVKVTFPSLYPLSVPLIELRADFDRSHPHLNPGPAGAPPVPCLVAGSPRELIQTRGFIGLIDQLVEWLEKASALELNDPAAGWEPVRRDHIHDIAVADSAALHALVERRGGAAYMWTPYIYTHGNIGHYRLHVPIEPGPFGPNDTRLFARRNFRSREDSGLGLAIAAWAGKGPDGQLQVAGRYRPEDVATLADLRARAAEYGCLEFLDAKLRHVASRLTAQPISIIVPIVVLLLPRRPYRVVGTGSSIETCGYLVEVGKGDDLLNPETAVRLLGHRDTPSLAVLRRTSGDDPAVATPPWTLIGCGSVGSKLALHLTRAGRAPGVLVDRDLLEPHNFARHAALPFDGERHSLYMISKTYSVAEMVRSLATEPKRLDLDALSLPLHADGRIAVAPSATAMIVNTTGSAVLREVYGHADWADRPPLVEACLLGAGRAAFVGIEGSGANPNASDLMAEAYNVIRQDAGLAEIVFSAEAEAIQIGQGCSTFSFALSDAQLSAFTASMAMVIAGAQREGLPQGGEVRLGRLGDDGVSQQWSRFATAPWIVVERTAADQPAIRIHPRVHAAIEADIAQWPGVETGGVLIGRFSQIGNCFQVVDTLPAPEDSTRSAAEFVLGTRGLKSLIDALVQSSRGTLQVIGTWHSHLQPSGPSGTDIATGALLATQQLGPLLMLIHTSGGYSALTTEAVGGGKTLSMATARGSESDGA